MSTSKVKRIIPCYDMDVEYRRPAKFQPNTRIIQLMDCYVFGMLMLPCRRQIQFNRANYFTISKDTQKELFTIYVFSAYRI